MSLKCQCIAFAGRMASLTHAEAISLIVANEAIYSKEVTPDTTLLVLGIEHDTSWRTGKIARAAQLRERGQPLTIIDELEFLPMLGVEEVERAGELFTAARAFQLTGIHRERMRALERRGFIQGGRNVPWQPRFDFFQLRRAQWADKEFHTLCRPRIVRDLRRLEPNQLDGLTLDGERPIIVDSSGRTREVHGQLLFEFPEPPDVMAKSKHATYRDAGPSPSWSEAIQAEKEGRLDEAASIYRKILRDHGGSATLFFNLGNILYQQRMPDAAAERFDDAVRCDASNASAWYNLGSVLANLGRCREAVLALQEAVNLKPDFANAHFNLALALERVAEWRKAQVHWRLYAAFPDATNTDVATERLRALDQLLADSQRNDRERLDCQPTLFAAAELVTAPQAHVVEAEICRLGINVPTPVCESVAIGDRADF